MPVRLLTRPRTPLGARDSRLPGATFRALGSPIFLTKTLPRFWMANRRSCRILKIGQIATARSFKKSRDAGVQQGR